MGNLYHLNAEEEPENTDYPKDPVFCKEFGPRGVIKSTADGKIEDTGPLTVKRMGTVDEETLAANNDFMERQVKANKPFFTWFNTTRMHNKTHLKDASIGATGLGTYADGIFGSNDWFPTFVAAAGDPNIKTELLKGYKTSSISYKVHLDGYNQLDYLSTKAGVLTIPPVKLRWWDTQQQQWQMAELDGEVLHVAAARESGAEAVLRGTTGEHRWLIALWLTLALLLAFLAWFLRRPVSRVIKGLYHRWHRFWLPVELPDLAPTRRKN